MFQKKRKRLALKKLKRFLISIKRISAKKNKRIRKTKNDIERLYYQKISLNFEVPSTFSLKNNTLESLEFINSMREIEHDSKKIFISFLDCKILNLDALSLLISIIKDLTLNGFTIWGNSPKNKNAKQIFNESGFFDHLKNHDFENSFLATTIIQEGNDKIDVTIAQNITRSCMKLLTGQESRNPQIYPMFIEMMANSINHAFLGKGKQKWLISKTHIKDENKIIISFIDTGIGILQTLNRKWFQNKLLKSLFINENDLLLSAFKGEIGSRTKLEYRGKGLPKIFRIFERGYISNLFILTNNAILDFENNKFQDITENFNGTLYSFEISVKNIKL